MLREGRQAGSGETQGLQLGPSLVGSWLSGAAVLVSSSGYHMEDFLPDLVSSNNSQRGSCPLSLLSLCPALPTPS